MVPSVWTVGFSESFGSMMNEPINHGLFLTVALIVVIIITVIAVV